MSDADLIAAIAVFNPRVLGKARRLAYAVVLVRQGNARSEVERLIRMRFAVSQPEAWKMMSMAWDVAGMPDGVDRRKVER